MCIRDRDRTIMVYRGASEYLSKINFKKAKWYYLAPLSGKIASLTQDIIDYAHKKNIQIAFNPGNSQLNLSKEVLQKMINKTNVLILNQEEAAILTENNFNDEDKIIEDLKKIHKRITVMTKGEKGVVVLDKGKIYSRDALPTKVIDKTCLLYTSRCV